jgi:hypothetical protein
VLDEHIGQASLIGIRGLLLLFAAELHFGLGRQTKIDDGFPHLRVEVRKAAGVTIRLRHGQLAALSAARPKTTQ